MSPNAVAAPVGRRAAPNAPMTRTLDVLRSLTSDFLFKGAVPGLTHIEPNKLRLCLELVQSAVTVATRDDGGAGDAGAGGGAGSDGGGSFPTGDAVDDSLVSLTMNSTLMYQGQEMAAAVAGNARKGSGGGGCRGGSPSNLYFPNGFP